jgi:hypothetical protein
MVIKCEELKEMLQQERKQKQLEFIEKDSENEVLKEKVLLLLCSILS